MLHYMAKDKILKLEASIMATNEITKIGVITLTWEKENPENPETPIKVVKSSPDSMYEEAESLLHCLNQKSVSGANMLDYALRYIKRVRESREDLPDNTRFSIEIRTDKYHKTLECLFVDYESFILVSTQLTFFSETFGDDKNQEKAAESDLSWLDDTDDLPPEVTEKIAKQKSE